MATINGGLHLRVCPVRLFDFTQFTGTGTGGTITLTLAEHIESSSVQEIDLVARTHGSSTMGSGGGGAVVNLLGDGYDFEDPSTLFYTSPIMTGISLAAGPSYKIVSNTTSQPFGRFVAVQLVVTLGSTPATSPKFWLSVDLTLKGGDPSELMMAPNSFPGFRIQ